jgi:hypothetical protein
VTWTAILSIEGFDDTQRLEIESDNPDELLWDAMMRALARRSGQEAVDRFAGEGWPNGRWYWTDPDDAAYFGVVSAGGDTTVRQMTAFLGDEAKDNPLTLGWGWGGEVIDQIVSIVSVVGDGTTVVGGIVLMRQAMRKIINRDRTDLMANYRDTGSMTMELEQAIKSLDKWEQTDFLTKFGTDPSTATKAMAQLGFELRIISGARLWVESDHQH